MPIYRLEPVEKHLKDSSWNATRLREACWVRARDENDARRQVEQTTKAFAERAENKATPTSPWLSATLTTCAIGEPKFEVPEDRVVSDKGRIFT